MFIYICLNLYYWKIMFYTYSLAGKPYMFIFNCWKKKKIKEISKNINLFYSVGIKSFIWYSLFFFLLNNL